MKTKHALVTLIVVSIYSHAGHLNAGTEIENGGQGQTQALMIERLRPTPPAEWCQSLQGRLRNILNHSELARTLLAKRTYLKQSLEAVVSELESGNIEFQPVTYNFLTRVLAAEAVIPAAPRSAPSYGWSQENQVAVLFLTQMFETAIHINSRFDLPHYIPYYQNTYGCHHCDPYAPVESFYADFAGAVGATLEAFFDHPPSRLVDALAYDRWELLILNIFAEGIVHDLNLDLFRRRLECIREETRDLNLQISSYLAGNNPLFPNDRSARIYAEQGLTRIYQRLIQMTGGYCH